MSEEGVEREGEREGVRGRERGGGGEREMAIQKMV